ncbi:MAG: DMT family transporter [Streptomycetaceae bacterium]|nr:DMT family transporter [Streptomycetaceae bacterium]
MTAAFALATSLLWGLADFGGGLLTRRFPALTVVVLSQAVATVVLGAIVLAMGGWSEAGPRLWFAAAAGVAGPCAMLCFYRALSLGPMGVVSPLATISVAVPVAVGLILGERPVPLQYVGILVAVLGIALAGGPQLRGAPVQRKTIVLTLAAAVGFGAVMALVSQASVNITGLFLALFVQRLIGAIVGAAALMVSVHRGGTVLPEGGLEVVRQALPAFSCVGLADVAANGTYAIATRSGPMAVAAVLASLYPLVTALAARGILKERLRLVQAMGAALALVGSLLLATG